MCVAKAIYALLAHIGRNNYSRTPFGKYLRVKFCRPEIFDFLCLCAAAATAAAAAVATAAAAHAALHCLLSTRLWINFWSGSPTSPFDIQLGLLTGGYPEGSAVVFVSTFSFLDFLFCSLFLSA